MLTATTLSLTLALAAPVGAGNWPPELPGARGGTAELHTASFL